MIDKQAIAVFNPQDRIEKAFQEAFHSVSGRYLTAAECKGIKRCLCTYRGLSNKVARDPQVVAKMLFGETNTSGLWYYPCDIVELRTVLSAKQVSWHAPILLFAPKAARKLMPEYPVCLVFDNSVAKSGATLGGLHLRESNRLNLTAALRRVMIRDYLNEHQAKSVYKIIKDCMGYVPTHLITDLPGVAYEKQASHNWYQQVCLSTGGHDELV